MLLFREINFIFSSYIFVASEITFKFKKNLSSKGGMSRELAQFMQCLKSVFSVSIDLLGFYLPLELNCFFP